MIVVGPPANRSMKPPAVRSPARMVSAVSAMNPPANMSPALIDAPVMLMLVPASTMPLTLIAPGAFKSTLVCGEQVADADPAGVGENVDRIARRHVARADIDIGMKVGKATGAHPVDKDRTNERLHRDGRSGVGQVQANVAASVGVDQPRRGQRSAADASASVERQVAAAGRVLDIDQARSD